MRNLFLFLTIILLFSACKKEDREVIYKVNCPHCAITYYDERGKIVQKKIRDYWEISFEARADQYLSLLAQNQDPTGQAGIVIKYGGVVRAQKHTREPFGIVMATYQVKD